MGNWVFNKNFVGHKGVGRYVQSDESKNNNRKKPNQEYSSVKAIIHSWTRDKNFYREIRTKRVLKHQTGFRQKSSRHFFKEKVL